MSLCIVRWVVGSGEEERTSKVSSADELDRLVSELETQAVQEPFMIEVERANGDTLAAGLGRSGSVLSFRSSSLDPPYFASLGAPPDEQPSQDLVVFFFGGHWSEFPARHLVPMDAAQLVLSAFCEGDGVPQNIAWEEV